MKISTNWLHDFVKLSPPLEHIADRLTLAGLEVKKLEHVQQPKDILFEIEVTTNRPDWLSHLGVAREIAAVENLSLKLPEIETAKSRAVAPGWEINLKEAEGCPYYTGVLIEGITPAETPEFIRERLAACGLRSISLVVDITNYVLLETGQPLHAFDADLIRGKEIRIRRAKSQETMIAIDGTELSLESTDLVIADAEMSVALAGVMGGRDSEVSEKTRNIFLESAFFNPRWVRRTSRRLGLHSESSYRFERRVDPEGVDFGRERALWLIKKYAKPRFVSTVIKAGEKPLPSSTNVLLNADDVEKHLGVAIKPHTISSVLTRLGLHVTATSPKSWKIKVPSFRSDLVRPIDLIEEIARIFGFENIPETLPERAPLLMPEKPIRKLEKSLRNFMVGIGCFESVTFSLISNKNLGEGTLNNSVQIANPQNKELCWMRPTLLPSLLEVIKHNRHAGLQDVFVFEIANTYSKNIQGKRSKEEKVLALALCGSWKNKTWMDASRPASFYDIKGILESMMVQSGIESFSCVTAGPNPFFTESGSEELCIGSERIGCLAEINPKFTAAWDINDRVFFVEISLDKLVAAVRWIKPICELPRFPSIQRDISVVVSEMTKSQDVQKLIQELGHGLIQKVEVFDLFRGGRIPKGYKNLGFCVTYQSQERTLISSEIQDLHASIASEIVKKFQASFQ